MSIPLGQVSLQQVRQDLDLSASGSILERPVLNRANKDSGANLADYSGIAVAPQIALGSPDWNPNYSTAKTHYGYKRYYPTDYAQGIGEIYLTSAANGPAVTSRAISSTWYSSSSTEFVQPFRVTESGTYRITGTVITAEYPPSGYAGVSRWQVAVVSFVGGWFSGSANNDWYLMRDYNTSINGTFSLSTSRPYGCLICYAIADGPTGGTGGGIGGAVRDSSFKNIRVVKQ